MRYAKTGSDKLQFFSSYGCLLIFVAKGTNQEEMDLTTAK